MTLSVLGDKLVSDLSGVGIGVKKPSRRSISPFAGKALLLAVAISSVIGMEESEEVGLKVWLDPLGPFEILEEDPFASIAVCDLKEGAVTEVSTSFTLFLDLEEG